MEKKQKIEFASKERKDAYLKEVIGFFQDERDEEIGLLAAEEILDFFLETIGDEIYQKAIFDVRKILKEKLDDLEVDLELLSDNKEF